MNKALRLPDYLGHILAAIERIKRHTADVDKLGFLSSELIQYAVIRNIEIIGEAANNIQRACSRFWSLAVMRTCSLFLGCGCGTLSILWGQKSII
jgi:uncharacterized protein with HEPN domain